jgi:hypothetical protein
LTSPLSIPTASPERTSPSPPTSPSWRALDPTFQWTAEYDDFVLDIPRSGEYFDVSQFQGLTSTPRREGDTRIKNRRAGLYIGEQPSKGPQENPCKIPPNRPYPPTPTSIHITPTRFYDAKGSMGSPCVGRAPPLVGSGKVVLERERRWAGDLMGVVEGQRVSRRDSMCKNVLFGPYVGSDHQGMSPSWFQRRVTDNTLKTSDRQCRRSRRHRCVHMLSGPLELPV